MTPSMRTESRDFGTFASDLDRLPPTMSMLWALLPPLYSLVIGAGLWLVYILAVSFRTIVPLTHSRKENRSVYLPYISLAGNDPPASFVFSGVMNLAAFGGGVIALFRFLQLRVQKRMPCVNACSLLVFFAVGFGMTLVGNFQLVTGPLFHLIGTFMTFILGVVYCWLQAIITIRHNQTTEGKVVAAVRFLLAGVITVVFILSCTLTHMPGAWCQWALVSFLLIYISTFGIEFRRSSFHISCSDGTRRHRRDTWSQDGSVLSDHDL